MLDIKHFWIKNKQFLPVPTSQGIQNYNICDVISKLGRTWAAAGWGVDP